MYAKQSGESLEMQNQCAEIRIRAERRGGELLKKQTIKGGERHKLHDGTYERKITLPPEISKSQSSRWQSIEDNIPEKPGNPNFLLAKNSQLQPTLKEAGIETTPGKRTDLTSGNVAVGSKPKKEYFKEIDISNREMRRKEAIASIPEDIFEDHILNTKDKKQELTNKSIQLA